MQGKHEPQLGMDLVEQAKFLPGIVAQVFHRPAYRAVVLLLDMGVVVLTVGATAGESGVVLLTPGEQVDVDELPSAVRDQALQRERQKRDQEIDGRKDPFWGLILHRLHFHPSRMHVGKGEGLSRLSALRAPIVGHQVHLDVAGHLLVDVPWSYSAGQPRGLPSPPCGGKCARYLWATAWGIRG